MITTSDTIILEHGSIEQYAAPSLILYPTYNPDTQTVICEVGVQSVSSSIYTNIKYFTFTFTKSAIDAQSITAIGNVDKWMQAVEKTLKATLEALNGSATFTIV